MRSLKDITFVAALSIVLFAASVGNAMTLGDVADGEREFVQQLLDRALYSLAEQFCYQQLEGLRDVNHQATWELLLSECHQQHAWNMDADSRTGMIRDSAERLTEFLRNNAPSAENDLMLRVRQIELLAAAGVMEEIVQAPISSLQLTSEKKPAQASEPPPRFLTPESGFSAEAIQQAQTLADALLKQIEEIRRTTDRDAVRVARERIRMVQTDLAYVNYRLAPATKSPELRANAESVIEAMQKSTSDEALRFRCRLMLAEIQLDSKDFEAFKLRLGSTQSAAIRQDEKASVAALRIRSLLRQGLPSEALQEYVEASKNGLTLTQELQTLRLQGLLQLLELLHQLEESPERDQLQKNTQGEFDQLREKTLALTTGIWHQRCLRIINHFDRVLQVGPDAALELEYVSELVRVGDIKTAHQRLLSLSQRLPGKSPLLPARILLEAGNLSIKTGEWTLARHELQQAKEKFELAKDKPGAAAADLLRVYVIGQQWNSKPKDLVSEADYLSAIDSHLNSFPDQTTVTQAREWKARLLQASFPIKAAREFLDLAKSRATTSENGSTKNEPSAKISSKQTLRLCLAGACLINVFSAPESGSTEPDRAETEDLKRLCQEFMTIASEVPNDQPDSPSTLSLILQCQQSSLVLLEPLPTSTPWPDLLSANRRLLDQLQVLKRSESPPSDSSQTANSSPEGSGISVGEPHGTDGDLHFLQRHAETCCHTMIVLCSVRQLAKVEDYQPSLTELKELTRSDRRAVAQRFLRQMNPESQPIPGDVQLAFFLISLLSESPDAIVTALSIDERLKELSMLQKLCQIANSTTAYDQYLAKILTMNLDEKQIARTAEIVTRSPRSQSSAASNQSSRKFWQSVQKRTKPGQDAWFEASLQLVLIAESTGDTKEAKRIFGVVDVLHPEWGSPARKAKAAEIRSRLENKK